MKQLFWASLLFLWACCDVSDGPFLKCDVSGVGEQTKIDVSIRVPHLQEMMLNRPDGSAAILRGAGFSYEFPDTLDFANLSSFTIDSSSFGSESESAPERLVPLLGGAGDYRLLIAENLETELEYTLYFECAFNVVLD